MTAKLRFGVVGLGFGANHARVLAEMDEAELVAVCDERPDRVGRVAKATGAKPFTDARVMLEEETLQAVVVAVPAEGHQEIALAAIAAGCAVLVEKPLAPSLAEGKTIASAAEAAGVPLMPGHIERFNPVIREASRLISEGQIGRIVKLTARRLAFFSDRSRRVDIGVIHDLAVHEVDIMRFLTGQEVATVFAQAHSGLVTPFEDSVEALLRFSGGTSDQGPTALLDVNWLSPRKFRTLEIIGSDGALFLDYDAKRLELQESQALKKSEVSAGEISGQPPLPALGVPVQTREPLAEELGEFVGAVTEGRPAELTATDGLAALAVADALLDAANSGQQVRVSRED